MTPKQQLRSLEKKMKRLQERNPEIDMKVSSRYYHDIQRFYELRQQHFHLQFEIEHCQTCGKKF